ncbi:ankyrin repeat protein [Haloferula luteola]|uniref:Ankyrin repeat protein n=1 Tax=Haloferula luteola TaxID=595692 RepID=A0A840V2V5_9BACT|nr:ankyrin repeat domain-containing protein [Haloferula luteola]MBB5349994.1 ankyrin repeat protein [Haloferula luteola]
MKRLALLALFLLPLHAEEAPLDDLLRDALYAEEVARDLAKAAEQYQQVLKRIEAHRPIAASALFRLAEIRREQGDKETAAALYQQLLRDYSTAVAETQLARQHLVELGGKLPEGAPAEDPNLVHLQELQALARSSPDLVQQSRHAEEAATRGDLPSLQFLEECGNAADPARLLSLAAKAGHLSIVRHLLEQEPAPDAPAKDAALFRAIEAGFPELATLLLESGANPDFADAPASLSGDRSHLQSTLDLAISHHRVDLATLLLKHGADPNFMVPDPNHGESEAPLHHAIRESESLVHLLIDHGADPNLATSVSHFTPLHVASYWNQEPDILQFLIKKGAQLEALTAPLAESDSASPGESPKWPMTPLHMALDRKHESQALLLLDAGASAQHPGILRAAVRTGNLKIITRILDAGARESTEDGDLLRLVATSPSNRNRLQKSDLGPDALEILKFLIQQGFSPAEEWRKQGMPDAAGNARVVLDEAFTLPELTRRSAITFFSRQSQLVLPLASPAESSMPPPLHQLLLHPELISAFEDVFAGNKLEWRRWRSPNEGPLESLLFDLASDRTLPPLQWGDVIELRSTADPASTSPEMRAPEFRWNLRKRIDLPITAEIAGSNRNFQLRGDVLVYDPTRDVLPHGDLAQVAPMLWNPFPVASTARVVIRREGWGDIIWTWGDQGFHLQAGDHLRLENTLSPQEAEHRFKKNRQSYVHLLFPDTPCAIHSSLSYRSDQGFSPFTLPTLASLIAEAYATAFDTSAYPRPWEQANVPYAWSLPHPDFSSIVIRRLKDDETEEVLHVDWEKAIAACTPETTADDVREADISLQPGDIVELSLKDDDSLPWRGFSAATARFFHGVLSGSVQIFPRNENPRLLRLNWQPVEWKETEVGWLPLLPKVGFPTFRYFDRVPAPHGSLAEQVGGRLTSIEREGDSQDAPLYNYYIKSGDRLLTEAPLKATQKVVPNTRPSERTPRPRVVVPPTPNR